MAEERAGGACRASSARRLIQLAVGVIAASSLWIAAACSAPGLQPSSITTDWPLYRGDLAGRGYSALAEITVGNVASLTRAWAFSLTGEPVEGETEPRSARSQATPIVVGDVMFLPTADSVVALDPTAGVELWRFQVTGGRPSRRGVAYWPGDGDSPSRVLVTAGTRLLALDAATGVPATGFGDGGEIDMVVPYLSVPLVWGNIVVVGANTPRPGTQGNGNARAYDARSGAKLWEFNSVPQPGEVGHETWAGESWRDRQGANAWPFYFTLDAERGHVYLPLAAPDPFAYGGDRVGNNLFANSLVAVDVRSGAYVWHFQTIHHDLWDHDPPAPPVLFDIPSDSGESVSALAVTTKSGYLYVLNRDTGEPVFGALEREMPPSEVPGEQASPTQPIPVKPPALSRVSYEPADLATEADTSAEHVVACAELIESLGGVHNQGPFTPWVLRAEEVAETATLLFPGLAGGHNWGGVAFDPSSSLLFAFSQDVGTVGWLEAASDPASLPYELRIPRPGSFDVDMGGQRWPCQKPPWGRLTAIDAATGEVAWQRPVGVTEGLPPEKANTGRPGRASAIATAGGVLFIASTDDGRLRALETRSGEELWATDLEQPGNANPMTYLGADGRQYMVVAATDRLLAFRLP